MTYTFAYTKTIMISAGVRRYMKGFFVHWADLASWGPVIIIGSKVD